MSDIEKKFMRAINKLPKQKSYNLEIPSKKDRQEDRKAVQEARVEKERASLKADIARIHAELKIPFN